MTVCCHFHAASNLWMLSLHLPIVTDMYHISKYLITEISAFAFDAGASSTDFYICTVLP